MDSLQVLKNEERAAANVLDDKTGATRTELPLYGARKQCSLPTPGLRGTARKSKDTNCFAYLLLFPSVRPKRNW
jgi:hypothetical protein